MFFGNKMFVKFLVDIFRQDVERAALACLDYGSRYRVLPMRSTILSALASLAVEEKALKKEPKFELLLNKFLQTSCYLYGQKYTNIMYVICLAKTGMLAMLRSYMMVRIYSGRCVYRVKCLGLILLQIAISTFVGIIYWNR